MQIAALLAGGVLAGLAYGLDAAAGPDLIAARPSFWEAVWTAEPHSSGVLEVVGSGGFALAAIALCVLICRTFLTWLVLPLRAVGAMPLTAYAAQIFIWAAVALAVLGTTRDLSAFRDLEPFWPMILGLVIGCTAWALLIGRGPLEWFDRPGRAAERSEPRG